MRLLLRLRPNRVDHQSEDVAATLRDLRRVSSELRTTNDVLMRQVDRLKRGRPDA